EKLDASTIRPDAAPCGFRAHRVREPAAGFRARESGRLGRRGMARLPRRRRLRGGLGFSREALQGIGHAGSVGGCGRERLYAVRSSAATEADRRETLDVVARSTVGRLRRYPVPYRARER